MKKILKFIIMAIFNAIFFYWMNKYAGFEPTILTLLVLIYARIYANEND